MIGEPLKPLSILGLKRVCATLGGLHKHKKTDPLFRSVSILLWSRRDSNPGPNTCPMSLLRVYFVIDFRQKSRKQTNQLFAYLL
jgi:hypothetical protein